jgi:hypothetical protein
MPRIDAGFPSVTLLAGLEARGIDHVLRLRANPAMDREAVPDVRARPGGVRSSRGCGCTNCAIRPSVDFRREETR